MTQNIVQIIEDAIHKALKDRGEVNI